MNADEQTILQGYINRGYSLFLKRVADGRKMSLEQVNEIAQGHVYLGQDAITLKLVDELGGIDQAIAKAAKLAKLDSYYTSSYPGKPDILNTLMSDIQGGNYLDEQMRAGLGEYYEPFMLLKSINKMDAMQARIPYYINLK